jgi:hypothetical protein
VNAELQAAKAAAEVEYNRAYNAATAEYNNATAQATADLKLAQAIFEKDTAEPRAAYIAAVDAAERAVDQGRIASWKKLNEAAIANGFAPLFSEADLAPRPTSREEQAAEWEATEKLIAGMENGGSGLDLDALLRSIGG